MADLRSTIDSYCATFNANDREAWLDLWAEDATMEDPVGTPLKRGREEIGAFFDQGQNAAPEGVTLALAGEPIICGDQAAFPFRVEVTVGGTKLGVVAIDVMRFDADARIVE